MKTKQQMIEWLNQHNCFNKDNNLSSGITRIIKNNKEILVDLQNLTNMNQCNNIAELLYNFINPNCNKVCQICGKPTKFKKYYYGYSNSCSSKCAHLLTSIKGKKSKIQRYGDSHYNNTLKNKATKLQNHGSENYVNYEKVKNTKLSRYGNAYYNNTNKRRNSCLAKYNVDNASKSPLIELKRKNTCLLKYGTESPSQSPHTKQLLSKKKTDKFLDLIFSENNERLGNIIPLFKREEFIGVQDNFHKNIIYKFKCTICNNEFEDNLNNGRVPICRICHPINTVESISNEEKDLLQYIKSIYGGNIIENDRNVISPLELDIYIPDKQLAIEYNGLYWHSENQGKGKKYHLNKTILCEQKNIRLIQIFSDEWIYKKSIVQEIIKNALGIYTNKIFARKCDIKYISPKQGNEFFDKYHIQGSCKCRYYLALLYNEEIVSLGAFKKSFNIEGYELGRFVNKAGTIIIGGFSKILSHFRKDYPGKITTYSDRRLFKGEVYRKANMVEQPPISPSYCYTKDYNIRENRMKFTKSNLYRLYPQYKGMPLTESLIMSSVGYDKIYDCGNWKFTLE